MAESKTYGHLLDRGAFAPIIHSGADKPKGKSMGGMDVDVGLFHDMKARQAEAEGGAEKVVGDSAYRTQPNPYSRSDLKIHGEVLQAHLAKLKAKEGSLESIEQQYRKYMDEYQNRLNKEQMIRVKRAMDEHIANKKARLKQEEDDKKARAEAIKARARQGEAADIRAARADAAGGFKRSYLF